MTVYNTKLSVIAQVEAESEEEAISKATVRLERQLRPTSMFGKPFEIYAEGSDAFISEPDVEADF